MSRLIAVYQKFFMYFYIAYAAVNDVGNDRDIGPSTCSSSAQGAYLLFNLPQVYLNFLRIPRMPGIYLFATASVWTLHGCREIPVNAYRENDSNTNNKKLRNEGSK